LKALFEQVTSELESSFRVLQLNMPKFDAPYHFHPEIELTYIRTSSGKRYIGSTVTDYEPGDIVLVGSNVPHCWISENMPLENRSQATVFQFHKDFWAAKIFDLPEMQNVHNLLEAANTGIQILGNTKERVIKIINDCGQFEGFERFIRVVEILHIIAVSNEKEPIDQYFLYNPSHGEAERIQKIYSYLIENYRKEISLKEIADIVCMAPTAFCRYFKSITRKTLIQVITEIRLNHARQLLKNTEKPVLEICYESGFGNISYFNKIFRKNTGYTPLKYRKLISK